MTREPVSEHYDSGPLGPRVRAALAAAAPPTTPPLGLQVVMGERFAAMGVNLVANLTAGRAGVAQIVATRGQR